MPTIIRNNSEFKQIDLSQKNDSSSSSSSSSDSSSENDNNPDQDLSDKQFFNLYAAISYNDGSWKVEEAT